MNYLEFFNLRILLDLRVKQLNVVNDVIADNPPHLRKDFEEKTNKFDEP
jgi:hypothetical protein